MAATLNNMVLNRSELRSAPRALREETMTGVLRPVSSAKTVR
jgi:hypothetical protein